MRARRCSWIPLVLAALMASGLSSCHLTFGGRGTRNRVVDRTLEDATWSVQPTPPSAVGRSR